MNKHVWIPSILKSESGASLLLALVVSSLLFLLVTILVFYGNTEMKASHKQDYLLSSLYIAEAGVERAIQEINQHLADSANHPLEDGMEWTDKEFNDGSYITKLSEKLNEHGESIGWQIDSEGTYQGEKRRITAWVRPEIQKFPSQSSFVVYGEQEIRVETISGPLGLGFLETHPIEVNGDAHANGDLTLKYNGLLTGQPKVNGTLSTTFGTIRAEGINGIRRPVIPMPEFDFDYARELAKNEGTYVPYDLLSVSVLGLAPKSPIFIEGDIHIIGLDLLRLSLGNRIIIVNGSINVLGDLGGELALNLIAKKNILFTGLATGLKLNGILFAQGDPAVLDAEPDNGRIELNGHAEVNGYVGGRKIQMQAGILPSLLGLISGKIKFQEKPVVFEAFSAPLGFKSQEVEIIEWEEQ